MRTSNSKRMRLFYWVLDLVGHVPGSVLTKRLLALRFVLFPLQSARWWLSEHEGYQIDRDRWLINGYHFDARMLHEMAHNKDKKWFRVIDHEGGTITIEYKPQSKF